MSRESCVSGVLFIVTTAINIHSFSVMTGDVTGSAALHSREVPSAPLSGRQSITTPLKYLRLATTSHSNSIRPKSKSWQF